MTTLSLSKDQGENEEALSELAWTLETSQGEFSLILARCNYANLREQITERLRQECAVELSTLVLQESDKTLYTKIRTSIGDRQPAALIVFGLESVRDLEQMLASTNQVREEFRKNFHFPLVLWISDQVLMQLARLASDLESWATTTTFAITADTLLDGLQRKADALFTTILDLGADRVLSNDAIFGSGYHVELQAALQDLQTLGQKLAPELQASLEFALGRDDHAHDQIDAALSHYQQSLNFWQQGLSTPQQFLQRQGVVLFHLGLCDCRQAEQHPTENRRHLLSAKAHFQQCLDSFEQAKSPVLVAKFINSLGEVLQQLAEWEELSRLAEKSLGLQQAYPDPVRLAQAYGFLAQVELTASRWQDAKQNAQKALVALANAKESQGQYQGLYLLLLAESEQHLGQQHTAIEYLKQARDMGVEDNPRLYIQILQALRSLYFEQQQYLEAFRTKLQRLSIEQQYGFRAFIGAGWLQPRRQAKLALTGGESLETVAPEITASDRQQDVERLIERIGRNDCKLIVIHGHSGVGKSSLVNAGLVPALKQKAIGTQDVLPVAMRVYTNWIGELGRLLAETANSVLLEDTAAILEQLRQNEQQNIRTVLIFDQFEEFFFYVANPVERRQFFEFLGEALHILSVKVILSLREDYLHYLLEGNRLSSMEIISNDILSKNILYPLGNFSPTDAKAIIEELTKRSHFYLESALVEQIVEDLADELNSVRPIELQIVGAQLQTENITAIAQYRQLGQNAKEELVKRYLAAVVSDCGTENKQTAELVLYLLTDEKGTRPLKTRDELEQDLQTLVADLTAQESKLDLILEIFVQSGLVVLLPEIPADRYQLVHDYLVFFIRQQQGQELLEELAELRQQQERSQAEIEQLRRERLEAELAREQEQRRVTEEELVRAEQAKQILGKANQKARQRIRIGSAVLCAAVVVAGATGLYAQNAVRDAQEQTEAANARQKKITQDTKTQIQQAKATVDEANKKVERTNREADEKTRQADLKVKDAQAKVEKATQEADTKTRQAELNVKAAQERVNKANVSVEVAQVKMERTTQEADAKTRQAELNVKAAQEREKKANVSAEFAQVKMERTTREADAKIHQAELNVKAAEAKVEVAESKLRTANQKVILAEQKVADAKVELAQIDTKLQDANKRVQEANKKVLDAETIAKNAKEEQQQAELEQQRANTELQKLYDSSKLVIQGDTHRSEGLLSQAIKDYTEAININPNNANAFNSRGLTYYQIQRYQDALNDFTNAIKLDSSNTNLLNNRGNVYYKMRHYSEALSDYDRAIHIKGNPVLFNNRGNTYNRMQRYQEALKDLTQAVKLNPKYALAFANLSNTYYKIHRYDEALENIKSELQLDNNIHFSDSYYYRRMLIYQALHRKDEAQSDLKVAIQIAKQRHDQNSENWSNTINLALYYLADRNSAQAESLYQEVLNAKDSKYVILDAIDQLNDFLDTFPDNSSAKSMRELLQNALK